VPAKQREYLLSIESEHYGPYLKGANTLDFLKVFWKRFTVLSKRMLKLIILFMRYRKLLNLVAVGGKLYCLGGNNPLLLGLAFELI
jgi:hypothetical protein